MCRDEEHVLHMLTFQRNIMEVCITFCFLDMIAVLSAFELALSLLLCLFLGAFVRSFYLFFLYFFFC